jgi:ubiquinone/menaquinone biosynthesis C-methylase UbiE
MIAGPDHILSQIPLPPGSHVADIGAGTGHYALALAEKLQSSQGKVFALDIQKDLLDRLQQDALQRGMENISIIWGNAENDKGTRLRNDSIDVVFITNTFFQIEHKNNFLQEVRRILKRGGQVVLVDWTDSFGGLGPRQDHIVAPEESKRIFIENNFSHERDIDAGAHHYGIIFHKA